MFTKKHILLTIDVEDWFQVENFKPWIPFKTWDQRELRVESNVHRLLELFDSIELKGERKMLGGWEVEKLGKGEKLRSQSNLSSLISSDQRSELNRDQLTRPNQPSQPNHPNQPIQRNQPNINPQPSTANKQQTIDHIQTNKIKATFFILGWLADRLPNLVREIKSRGHEIGSHGCNHELPKLLSIDDLKQDLSDSRKLLEDITGAEVVGYRAPSFAINDEILKIIEDVGYLYDSSYNSFGFHGRYGRISLNGTCKLGIGHKLSDNFYELPIGNLMINRWVLPLGGGAYFRIIPVSVFNLGIKKLLRHQDAYMFYAHPWEFDPEQPMVNQASFNFKFRHYTNLNKTQAKLRSLIESFSHCNFVTCSYYLKLNGEL